MNDNRPHLLVVTLGSAGDLFPSLRLGIALQRAGHRVTVLGPDLHAPYVAQAGLAFHGLPADPAVLADPDLWHPSRGFAVIWRALGPAMHALRSLVAAIPAAERVLMVVHPLALAEADVYRQLHPGIRIVAAWLAPSNLRTVHDPLMLGPVAIPRWVPLRVRRWLWRLIEARILNPVALPDINRARRAAGLAPSQHYFDLMQQSADLSVALFPAWFGPPQPDWPQPLVMGDFTLYDPAPDAALPPAVAAFLAAGAPPLVFTPGTGNQQAQRYFELAVATAARLGRRAILLTPHRAQLPATLPATVLWVDYLPLRVLLPHVAALVHHGGIGTTAEALRAGIPQLIVALAYDQFDNGARVQALGAGLGLKAASLTGASLTAALARLLGDSALIACCQQLRRHFDSATAMDTVVDSISKLISETGKI